MEPFGEYVRYETRRQFFSRGANAVGWAALASLLSTEKLSAGQQAGAEAAGPLNHLAPQPSK